MRTPQKKRQDSKVENGVKKKSYGRMRRANGKWKKQGRHYNQRGGTARLSHWGIEKLDILLLQKKGSIQYINESWETLWTNKKKWKKVTEKMGNDGYQKTYSFTNPKQDKWSMSK